MTTALWLYALCAAFTIGVAVGLYLAIRLGSPEPRVPAIDLTQLPLDIDRADVRVFPISRARQRHRQWN